MAPSITSYYIASFILQNMISNTIGVRGGGGGGEGGSCPPRRMEMLLSRANFQPKLGKKYTKKILKWDENKEK